VRKKKTESIETIEIPYESITPKLTAVEYWEWRTTIAEMNASIEKKKASENAAKVLQKDVEVAQVKFQLHVATQVRATREEADSAKNEYFRFKRELETKLGISLNDKTIDDVTFEIRDLPKEPTTISGENK
jgi:hypothetical protein